MNSFAIEDIFGTICGEFTRNIGDTYYDEYVARTFLKLELISKKHKNIIRNNYRTDLQIYIANNECLEFISSNYKLQNFILSDNIDVNGFIDKLKNCHSLSFRNELFSENIVKLKKCHTLIFSQQNLTDNVVKKLKYCHTLDLHNSPITDKSVKKLKNCHNLNLTCTNITDASLKKLKNCHTLGLANNNISDKGIRKLTSCHTLCIVRANICDKTLKRLKNVMK